jgi:CRISPR-associated protein Cmr3
MVGLQLSPVDTFFFRDSRSYAVPSTSPEHIGGQFPPQPTTVVGAVRAWLARGNGWEGRGYWKSNPDVSDVLGTGYGPDSLGRISFDGPYVLRRGEPVYPMPAHVVGTGEGEAWRPVEQLRPGRPVWCDLGEAVRLPEASSRDVKLNPGTGWWVTRAGMAAILRGEVPAVQGTGAGDDEAGEGEVLPVSALWATEERIGIQRDDDSRTVQERMLYTSRHVRPAKDTTIGVRVGGVPREWWARCVPVVPLGGEARWAEQRPWNGDARVEPPLSEIGTRAAVVALTPIHAGAEFYRPGGRIPQLGDATVVSACLPRVERVGGWASAGARPGPVSMCSILPAGSVLFCDIKDPHGLRTAIERAAGPLRIGGWQKWGFGAVALGVWSED